MQYTSKDRICKYFIYSISFFEPTSELFFHSQRISRSLNNARGGNIPLHEVSFLQVINLVNLQFFIMCQVVYHAFLFTAQIPFDITIRICTFVICDPLSWALYMPLLFSVLFLTSKLKRIIKNLHFFVIRTKGNGIQYHQSKIDFVSLLKKQQQYQMKYRRKQNGESSWCNEFESSLRHGFVDLYQ